MWFHKGSDGEPPFNYLYGFSSNYSYIHYSHKDQINQEGYIFADARFHQKRKFSMNIYELCYTVFGRFKFSYDIIISYIEKMQLAK